MTGTILNEVFLPLALALIMFGMGLTLTRSDFFRLWQTPKPIFVGLFGQLLLLPILAIAICFGFDLSPPLAVGLMILAACPGGTMSNLISHLSNANLALSISLTAVCTIVCVFTTPFVVRFFLEYFAGDNAPDFSLIKTSIGLILVTLVPILLGMMIRHCFTLFALKSEVFFKRFSMLFMILVIAGLLFQERSILADSFSQVFGACLTLNLLSTSLGVMLGKIFNLSQKDAITLGIEVGIQNSTVAILIAISLLNAPAYALSAGVYGLTMYVGAGLLAVYAKCTNSEETAGEVKVEA